MWDCFGKVKTGSLGRKRREGAYQWLFRLFMRTWSSSRLCDMDVHTRSQLSKEKKDMVLCRQPMAFFEGISRFSFLFG